jgi:hypothetical protein
MCPRLPEHATLACVGIELDRLQVATLDSTNDHGLAKGYKEFV